MFYPQISPIPTVLVAKLGQNRILGGATGGRSRQNGRWRMGKSDGSVKEVKKKKKTQQESF